jgi:hypothetical protein
MTKRTFVFIVFKTDLFNEGCSVNVDSDFAKQGLITVDVVEYNLAKIPDPITALGGYYKSGSSMMEIRRAVAESPRI